MDLSINNNDSELQLKKIKVQNNNYGFNEVFSKK